MRGISKAIVPVIFLSVSQAALAMPWDVDMYSQQSLVPGEIARQPVKGTIPVGYKPWKMTTEEASNKLVNPVPVSTNSLQRGKRLYSSNCVPCHGVTGDGKGPVGPAMTVPSILIDTYAQKPDGAVYGVLMNGGSNMPRYGYKFSENDRWHIVNYLRYLQGKKGKE